MCKSFKIIFLSFALSLSLPSDCRGVLPFNLFKSAISNVIKTGYNYLPSNPLKNEMAYVCSSLYDRYVCSSLYERIGSKVLLFCSSEKFLADESFLTEYCKKMLPIAGCALAGVLIYKLADQCEKWRLAYTRLDEQHRHLAQQLLQSQAAYENLLSQQRRREWGSRFSYGFNQTEDETSLSFKDKILKNWIKKFLAMPEGSTLELLKEYLEKERQCCVCLEAPRNNSIHIYGCADHWTCQACYQGIPQNFDGTTVCPMCRERGNGFNISIA